MAKMTAEERQDRKEFSEASSKLGRAGWNAYMYARMTGSEHDAAMELGFAADFEAHRAGAR